MNKIYIAAPWTKRELLPGIATRLTEVGYVVTHDWWNHEAGDEDRVKLTHLAGLDAEGVRVCDTFVLLNFEKSEGKAFESGMAYILGKRLMGVGPRYSNIFQNLPQWEWFSELEPFYERMHEINRLKLGIVTW